eukprot:TRINITY_DN4197_c1_g1_i3.p1 TRINITY_DN4197_c1_g1~~TRINITY_DN4197_c1_g1_i3.p1  ORF type:complete len:527 (-),score=86.14 TRINITY_DN4197_c1_g1_i3:89-1669(-)
MPSNMVRTEESEELSKHVDALTSQTKNLQKQLKESQLRYENDVKTLELRTAGLDSRLTQAKTELDSQREQHKKTEVALNQKHSELQILLSNTQFMLAEKELENQRLVKALVTLKNKIPKTTQTHAQCPSCGASASSATAKFCGECATPFTSSVHVPRENIPQSLQAKPQFPNRSSRASRFEPSLAPPAGSVLANRLSHRTSTITAPAPETSATSPVTYGSRVVPGVPGESVRRSSYQSSHPSATRTSLYKSSRPTQEAAEGGAASRPYISRGPRSSPPTPIDPVAPQVSGVPVDSATSRTVQGNETVASRASRFGAAEAASPFYAPKEARLMIEFPGNHSGKRGEEMEIVFQVYHHSEDENNKRPAPIPFSDIKTEVLDTKSNKLVSTIGGGGNSFSIRFTATEKGQHIVKIQVRNIAYTLRVPISGQTSTLSYVKGSSIALKGEYKCTLIAVDEDGDAQCVGGDTDFTFSILAPAGTVENFVPKDMGDGTYQLSMVILERLVNYQIHVKHQGKHVQNSPFEFRSA